MLRKLLLIIACTTCSITTISFTQETNTTNSPEEIAFVLFRLVGSEMRMEKYGTQDLTQETTTITKQQSNDSLVLSINLKEKGAMPRVIQWDDAAPGKINILTGRGNKTNIHSLLLTSLFKETTKGVVAVCFDCKVEKRKTPSQYP